MCPYLSMLAAPPNVQWSIMYVNCVGFVGVSVKCVCGAPSINQVGPGSAAERGLQRATHPAGALGRSNVLSALMRSRCPFSLERGKGGQQRGRM